VNLRKDHYRVSPRAALVVVAANDVQSHRYGQRGRTTGPERPSVVDRNDYSVEGVAGYLARSTDRSTGVSGTEADRFGLGAMRRFKEPAVVGPSPRASFFVRSFFTTTVDLPCARSTTRAIGSWDARRVCDRQT
jgi:hypothetical protein